MSITHEEMQGKPAVEKAAKMMKFLITGRLRFFGVLVRMSKDKIGGNI